jgi:hypothetical protein
MSLNPLVCLNGILKLEISQAGISVVAHISEKNILVTADGNYVYANAITMMDKHLQFQSYLHNLIVLICVIHRTDAPASRQYRKEIFGTIHDRRGGQVIDRMKKVWSWNTSNVRSSWS